MNDHLMRPILRRTLSRLARLALLSASALFAACQSGGGTGSAPPVAAVAPLPVPASVATSSSIGDFPDPFVLADGGAYYAYATNANGKNVQLLRSADLHAWSALPDAMPVLASWVRQPTPNVWAPEVIKLGERYVLYYTARDRASDRQCVGAAEAASPAGPFVDHASAPLVCQSALGGTIDPSPLLDNGHLYLYFKSDGNCCGQPTHIFVQELRADGLAVSGQPVMLLTNEQTWQGQVIEAPTMFLHDGQYYLFYSANDYSNASYAVGYARCQGPAGPCQVVGDGPFLKSSTEAHLMGPGHQDVFQVGAQTWIAYHAWELKADGTRGNRRFLYIDKIDWVDGKPVVRGTTLIE